MFHCNSTNITEYTCDLYINTFIAYIAVIGDIRLALWLLEPLIHSTVKVLSPHILVSFFRQTTHQSVDTMNLSWLSIVSQAIPFAENPLATEGFHP